MNPCKLLVVEDDKEVRNYLTTVFEEEGCQVLGLHDGQNFLAQFNEYQPDVVLLDLHLPGQDSGVDLLKIVRSHSSSRFVPVLMVSGDDEENAKVTSLEIGADDYVVKPINPRELVARGECSPVIPCVSVLWET
jgi:DNA-binding response OmpR family regulator